VEQKLKQTLGIPFRTIPRKRKQLGIPFCGTKMQVNFPEFNISAHDLNMLEGTGNFRFVSLSQMKVPGFSVRVVDLDPVGSA
jgi:hypothetical protein